MAKASVYKQLDARQMMPGPFTKPSPRLWNCSLLKYKGRLWCSYRYHLGVEHQSRCATAMVPLDRSTFQPTASSQHLNLPGTIGDEHFEDARLFMFNGSPHISYSQMTGYQPGVNYCCHIRYARLKLLGNRWIIEETFHPKYGLNHGSAKEKNWTFFEHDKKLYAVYQDTAPMRKVIQIDGEKVVAEYETPVAEWPWGPIRGGTPPIPYGPTAKPDGTPQHYLTIFHSSIATEEGPHFVRYYAGAYLFEAKPPFALTAVSLAPLAAGSEEDGHGYDPRYSNGWKPYVVFPCGLVPEDSDWLVSLGVNDWQCAVGRIRLADLRFVSPDRSDVPMRYFRTLNGTLPARFIGADGVAAYLQWEVVVPNLRGLAPTGYFATADGREAEALEAAPRSEEITLQEYRAAGCRQVREKLALPVFG